MAVDSIFPTSREISKLAKYSYDRKRKMLVDLAKQKLSSDRYNDLATAEKLSLLSAQEGKIKNKINGYCSFYGLALAIGFLFVVSGSWLILIGLISLGWGNGFPAGKQICCIPEWELKDLYSKEIKNSSA